MNVCMHTCMRVCTHKGYRNTTLELVWTSHKSLRAQNAAKQHTRVCVCNMSMPDRHKQRPAINLMIQETGWDVLQCIDHQEAKYLPGNLYRAQHTPKMSN